MVKVEKEGKNFTKPKVHNHDRRTERFRSRRGRQRRRKDSITREELKKKKGGGYRNEIVQE